MAINRAPFNALIDDDGSNTVSSVWNKAAIKDVLLDPIDAAIALGIVTTAVTGAQALTITPTTRVLHCANASLLTITALTGSPLDGQVITIVATGTGVVDLADGTAITSGILTGVGQRVSLAPGSASPFHNGRAAVIYDAALSQWRVIAHEQGAWLPWTPVWGNTGTPNTVGASNLVGAYHLSGRTLRFRMEHTWSASTVAGSGAFTYTFPFAINAAAMTMPLLLLLLDASVGGQVAGGKPFTASTWVGYNVTAPTGFTGSAPFVWTTGDSVFASGVVEL